MDSRKALSWFRSVVRWLSSSLMVCSSSQGVDRRPVPVLARAVAEPDEAVVQHQVPVGWRHVDAAVPYALARAGVRGRERPLPAEDARQQAGSLRREVQDHQDGGAQVLGQGAGQAAERLDAASRRADNHDAAVRHRFSRRT
jgi:hypothetical protein